METYIEHEKLKAISDKSQSIGDFLEWCESKDMMLATFGDGTHNELHIFPVRTSKEKLLANYFDINLNVLETEKRHMLDNL